MTSGGPPDVGEERLRQLFDGQYDRLRRFCVVRAGSESVAADVTADTFVEAARLLARDPSADVDAGWLFMVARRRLTDHWRRAERQRNKLRKLIAHRVDVVVDGPNAGHPDDLTERVRRSLDDLPDAQRAALTLRYLDGASVAEVAEHLDLSYRAAESLLARARRAFVASWRNA